MADDQQPPEEPPAYQPPVDPWAVPGAPAGRPYIGPPYIPPGQANTPSRSRSMIWVVAVIVVVVLAISGAGIAVVDGRHHNTGSAAAVGAASSSASAAASSPAPVSPAPSAVASAPSGPSGSSPSGPVGTSSAPATGVAPSAGSGPLDQYLLSPAEVASGASMYLIDGGRSTTDQATLDWCNFKYTSETQRTARVQVEYAGDYVLDPSGNEFVRYSAGGTTKAYAEIQQAVAGCPATTQTDGYIYGQVQRAPRDAALASHQLVLSFSVLDPTGQLDMPWQAIVYQFNGNYFSGVYVYGLSRASALTEAERLGAESARHLAQAVAGKSGTGGGPFQTLSAPPAAGEQD